MQNSEAAERDLLTEVAALKAYVAAQTRVIDSLRFLSKYLLDKHGTLCLTQAQIEFEMERYSEAELRQEVTEDGDFVYSCSRLVVPKGRVN